MKMAIEVAGRTCPVGFLSTVSYVTGWKDEAPGLSSVVFRKSHTQNVRNRSHALGAGLPRVRVYIGGGSSRESGYTLRRKRAGTCHSSLKESR